MAKKSNRKNGSKKHYPVQRHILLGEGADPSSNSQSMLVKVDRELSRVNHRLYRQSRVPSCKISIDGTLPDGYSVDVFVLRDTWMNQKAYQMAKETFDKNSAEERAQLSTMAARWNDFRVDFGINAQALDATIAGGHISPLRLFGVGEYELSQVTDKAGNANTFRWLGSGIGTWNIIDEYDRTGNTDSTPSSTVATAAYQSLEDEIDSNQLDHLSDDGNLPPYSANTIHNEVLTKVATLYVTTGDAKLSTGFFNAPCGLIYLFGEGGATSLTMDQKITLEVQAGDYKGIKAPSYLE
jgi:hypothetical protein